MSCSHNLGGLLAMALAVIFGWCTMPGTAQEDSNDMQESGIKYQRAKSLDLAEAIDLTKPAKYYQKLQSTRWSNRNPRGAAAIVGAHQRELGTGRYQNITPSSAYGSQYSIEVLWNGSPMQMYFDTASSDTWAVGSNYTCVDFMGSSTSRAACQFGPAYPGRFQYGPVEPPQHLFLRNGDEEMVKGPFGYSDISMASLTVKKQQVALVDKAFWYGNNITSGTLGLAYPSLTAAYDGDEDRRGDKTETIPYNPIFTSMYSQGLCAPVFSIALMRNKSGGIVAFGGVPPIPGINVDTQAVATTDIVIANLDNSKTSYQYSFYTIYPDNVHWDSMQDNRKIPYIVDAGTTQVFLPGDIAAIINGAFKPPAFLDNRYGYYFVACDAVPPVVGVTVGGVRLDMNPADLIYRDLVDPNNGWCMTAIADGGSGPYILGDTFLQNVVAVFNIAEAKMHFISHAYY